MVFGIKLVKETLFLPSPGGEADSGVFGRNR